VFGLISIVARFLNQPITPDWIEAFETCFHFHLLLATACVVEQPFINRSRKPNIQKLQTHLSIRMRWGGLQERGLFF
jgi:hypothetical protein